MEFCNDNAVRCHQLLASYGAGATRVAALRGADLDVRMGELLMLVGPSGCGKTTLLSIIAGILDQDGGQCTVLGRDWLSMGADQRIAFRGSAIGFVFQAFNLLPALTVAENVAVPLIINGVQRKLALARARAMLASVNLTERADQLVTKLSGGQQQRVAIARALVHAPALLICDEPTSSLDHASGQQIMTILRSIARAPQRAVLVVTHDARIFHYADRIARMEDGTIVDMSNTLETAVTP
ncbi:ABC transporter ATP-binding protein [Massilia sp. PWRC2]|uniref:ABC transporter ATP-binding protein n=1 Tax=Massilia sp. PWRC2 TaxID=2804626 RepID=UPI003CEDE0FF